jgi:hypothetical protein
MRLRTIKVSGADKAVIKASTRSDQIGNPPVKEKW